MKIREAWSRNIMKLKNFFILIIQKHIECVEGFVILELFFVFAFLPIEIK